MNLSQQSIKDNKAEDESRVEVRNSTVFVAEVYCGGVLTTQAHAWREIYLTRQICRGKADSLRSFNIAERQQPC